MLVPPTPHGSAWSSRCLKILANSMLLCYTTGTWKCTLMPTSHSWNLLQRIHIFVFCFFKFLNPWDISEQNYNCNIKKWLSEMPITFQYACTTTRQIYIFFYMLTFLLNIDVFNQQKIGQSHPKLCRNGPHSLRAHFHEPTVSVVKQIRVG